MVPGPPQARRAGGGGRAVGRVRQWIESVNQTLKGQLSLQNHGERTLAGVFTRVAQRLLAAGIWHNWTRRHLQAVADHLRPQASFTESTI